MSYPSSQLIQQSCKPKLHLRTGKQSPRSYFTTNFLLTSSIYTAALLSVLSVLFNNNNNKEQNTQSYFLTETTYGLFPLV